MPSYLVETYLARGRSKELAGRDRRARSAAEELTRRQLRPLDSRSRGRGLLLRLRCTVEPGRAPCGRARRARSDPRRRSDLVLTSKGGHMKSKWMFALLGVLAVVGVFAGTVLATPPSGQTTTTLARAPLEPMNLKVKSDPRESVAAEAQDPRGVGRVRGQQHVRRERRHERLALAPGPERDLRHRRHDHDAHVRRAPLHAAGLHRRPGHSSTRAAPATCT